MEERTTTKALMSKSPSHGRKQKTPPPDLLDLVDGSSDYCANIVALGELLAHCDAKRLRPETIAVVVALICDEARRLRQHFKIKPAGR